MVHHGFYQSISRYAYPENYRLYWDEQVQRGMTTSTVYFHGHEYFDTEDKWRGTALHIEELLESGLIRIGCPVLCASMNPEDIVRIKQHASVEWPELVMATAEEPSVEDIDEMRECADGAHEIGLRAAGAMAGYLIDEEIGDLVDIWIITADTWVGGTEKYAVERGKEAWSYFTYDFQNEPERARHYSGIWSWARGVPCSLTWAYTHNDKARVHEDGTIGRWLDEEGWTYSYAIPSPNGVLSTPAYDALAAGISDCRALEWADENGTSDDAAFLEELRDLFPGKTACPPQPLRSCDWATIYRKLGELHQRVG